MSRHQGGLRHPPEPNLQYSTVLASVYRHQGGLGHPPEPHLGTLLLNLGQSRNQGGQGSIVLGLKMSEIIMGLFKHYVILIALPIGKKVLKMDDSPE